MKIVKTLICYGLRQVLGDITDTLVEGYVERFTDESDALRKAVEAANERAWQALHVALAGDSYWERFKRYVLGDATQRALRQQIEPVLRKTAAASKINPEQLRTDCLSDLVRLRHSDAFKLSQPLVAELKQQTVEW